MCVIFFFFLLYSSLCYRSPLFNTVFVRLARPDQYWCNSPTPRMAVMAVMAIQQMDVLNTDDGKRMDILVNVDVVESDLE